MRELTISIPFVPVPKARPRVGKTRTVMPKRYKGSRGHVAWYMVDARNRAGPWEKVGSYHVEIVFFGKTRGDVDNLAGTILDAGTGVLWDDDRQVLKLSCEKRLLGEPGTTLVVRRV